MIDPDCPAAEQNPFCASRLRPGTISFVFGRGESVEQLVERLGQAGWRGQIVGPNGSGKSTLLATLLPAIELPGQATRAVTLRQGQRRLPREFCAALRRLPPGAVAAVDGYEQLGLYSRLRLKFLCRRRGLGLLVTSHQPVGLPDLYRTAIDVPRAWQVVERLERGFPPRVAVGDLVECLARRRMNLREALFDLYDLYAARRPSP
ncbi:MAG: hypothetical protein ABSF26_23950 [Thermoguttaceae bacterium]|jgi:hypothetical protein